MDRKILNVLTAKITLLLTVAFFISCSNDVKKECDLSSETESSIKMRIIGNWRLETIQSGWTGNVTKPDSNTVLE